MYSFALYKCLLILLLIECTINSKINGTLKGVYLPILKLHSILAVANLLAHNNITINNYYVKVNSLRLKSRVTSKWASKHLWGYHLFCCWWHKISLKIFTITMLCSYAIFLWCIRIIIAPKFLNSIKIIRYLADKPWKIQ